MGRRMAAYAMSSFRRRRVRSWVTVGVLVVLVCASPVLSAPRSVREVDFNNFDYIFARDELAAVPTKLTWLPPKGSVIPIRDGRYRFSCEDSPCPLLTVDYTVFGDIAGLSQTAALVVMTYHSGGTASWQYVYVVSMLSETPRVVACLETGARAYMGLSRLSTNQGNLVVTVNDPEKRVGDCCSSGTITYRYRRNGSSFERLGQPVFSERGATERQ
jgi:hypothetical protein